MGLFSSSTETQQQTESVNRLLGSYTSPYRKIAPWAFASLDPEATLAAMGSGTKLGNKNLGANFKKRLQGMSADEKNLEQANRDTLARIKQRQESGQFLTPKETEFINTSLDKAFEFAHKTGYEAWQRGAQELAGGRGLRTSDTPVAQQALRELSNFEVGLGSKRAELGLGATLDFAKNQQMFDEGFREFNEQLKQNKWATRQGFMFGGGLSGAGNIAQTTSSYGRTTGSPSMMSNIGQTIGVASSGLKLAGQIGAFGSGFMQ